MPLTEQKCAIMRRRRRRRFFFFEEVVTSFSSFLKQRNLTGNKTDFVVTNLDGVGACGSAMDR
jgi:hypothetical protein